MPDPPQDWPPSEYPGENLGWSIDTIVHTVSGGAVRAQEDYPCQAPFPCNRVVFGSPPRWLKFHPGRLALLTLHRTRAVDLINEGGSFQEPLCRHHFGYWTINERGRLAPVVFSIQYNGGNEDDEVFVSVGKFTVIDAADRDEEQDLLGFGTPGRAVAVNTIRLPEWVEGAFDSFRSPCGDVGE